MKTRLDKLAALAQKLILSSPKNRSRTGVRSRPLPDLGL